MTDQEETPDIFEHLSQSIKDSAFRRYLERQVKNAEKTGMPIEDYLIAHMLNIGILLQARIYPLKDWDIDMLNDPEYLDDLKDLAWKYHDFQKKVQETDYYG